MPEGNEIYQGLVNRSAKSKVVSGRFETSFSNREAWMVKNYEDEKPSVRLHIYLPAEEIDAIDNRGFDNGIRARTKAICELAKLGLEASQVSNSRSTDD